MGDADPLLRTRPTTLRGLEELLERSWLLRELHAGVHAAPLADAPPSPLLRRNGAIVTYAMLSDMYREASHSQQQLKMLLQSAAARIREMQAALVVARGAP